MQQAVAYYAVKHTRLSLAIEHKHCTIHWQHDPTQAKTWLQLKYLPESLAMQGIQCCSPKGWYYEIFLQKLCRALPGNTCAHPDAAGS